MRGANKLKNKPYFAKVVENLEREAKVEVRPDASLVFSTLKILEYWVRVLQKRPDCINKNVAIRLMSESYLTSLAQDVVKIFKPLVKNKDKMGDFRTNECRRDVLLDVERYMRESNPRDGKLALTNFLKSLGGMDNDDMSPKYYNQLLDCIRNRFLEFCMDSLKAGVAEGDVSFCHAQQLKKTFRLDDDEMEVLMYLWLCSSPDIDFSGENSRGMFSSRRHYNDFADNDKSFANIVMATGFSEDKLTELLSPNRSLSRLGLLDEDLDIACDVKRFLTGIGKGVELKDFKRAGAPKVSFQQLQGKNPDAKLALEMIRNHDGKSPMNILFYGIEGTGKTELAKAIAKELKRPLWEVCIDSDEVDRYHRRSFSRNADLTQYRIRSIYLANWQCEQKPGIILVDEADMVLNCAEKGCLNNLFEELSAPVIWISNSMMMVENSTRRRFNFSMAFKGLAKDERLSVLNSVLKIQKATKLLTEEEKLKLVVEYPVMAGGYTLAVQGTKHLLNCGSATDAYKTMAKMLKAHAQLLGIKNGSMKDVESHAPNYSLEGLNIEGSVNEIMDVVQNFDHVWEDLEEDSAPNSLNILLYGPPGTGKTEFVRYLARSLGRNLIIKRGSDLLGMYVGQTEAQIAAAFEEANRTKSILFFDEADSFLNSRTGAIQNWEVTKVNELLTQMENFKGIFIAATNFDNMLDPASKRRFALKLGFNYLKPEGIRHIWEAFFPESDCPDSVARLDMLTPGDFNAVFGRMKYFPVNIRTPERIESELRKELRAKDDKAGRSMGF